MSIRREVIYFARHRYLTARIHMIILAPTTLTLAHPHALLPVMPEDTKPLTENLSVSHDSVPF
jgi:hypothetical protein